jgi:hypothetical protein
LLRLYQLGEVDDQYLERESASLKSEQDRLHALLPNQDVETYTPPSEESLAEMCLRVRVWLETQGHKELPLIASALQLSIQASKRAASVAGVIPDYAPDSEHADVRAMVT